MTCLAWVPKWTEAVERKSFHLAPFAYSMWLYLQDEVVEPLVASLAVGSLSSKPCRKVRSESGTRTVAMLLNHALDHFSRPRLQDLPHHEPHHASEHRAADSTLSRPRMGCDPKPCRLALVFRHYMQEVTRTTTRVASRSASVPASANSSLQREVLLTKHLRREPLRAKRGHSRPQAPFLGDLANGNAELSRDNATSGLCAIQQLQI